MSWGQCSPSFSSVLGAVLAQLLLPLHPGEQVVTHWVQHVDRAAVHVRHKVLAQGGKGMYHSENPLSFLFGMIDDDFEFEIVFGRFSQKTFPMGEGSTAKP